MRRIFSFTSIVILLSAGSVISQPADQAIQEKWQSLGFPAGLDRRVRLTDDQVGQLFNFFGMFATASEERRDDDLKIYVAIMKWGLTPMEGDDVEWGPRFNTPELRMLAGTPYASDIIPLLRPLLQSTTHRDTTRVLAAYTMAILGNKDNIEDVLSLLASEKQNVRGVAKKTLKLMGVDLPANFDR